LRVPLTPEQQFANVVNAKPKANTVSFGTRALAAVCGIATQVGGIAMGAWGPFGGDYSWTVMLLSPFMGAFVQSSILFRAGMQSTPKAYWDVVGAGTLVLASLLVFALEGIICILMCMPILLPLWLFGTWVATLFAERVFSKYPWMIGLVALTPGATSLPVAAVSEASPREVVTVIEIAAPPEVIWRYVTNFPEIPANADVPWTFSLGYPKPIRCDLEGSGVGAMRYCRFTGGSFDERVTVWDEGRELSFTVEGQPKKIDHFIRCTKGQFLLERLPDGGTRVTGTTWYGIAMDPSLYFGLWSDKLIHDIHVGVLEHIKRLAEAE